MPDILHKQHRRVLRDRFWLVTNDPGGWHFTNALRATLASLAASILMLLFYAVIVPGQKTPTATIVFTLVITLLSTQLVFNHMYDRQMKTTFLLVIPLVVLSQLAALVAAFPWLANLILLGCIFAMFYIRRFGARFAVLGLIGLYCYYLPINKHVTIQQLPWLFIASCVAVVCAYSFRFLLFPPRPDYSLLRGIDVFELRLRAVVDISNQLLSGTRPLKQRLRTLNHCVIQLHTCSDALQVQLLSPDLEAMVGKAMLKQISLALYEADLAVETLRLSLTGLVAYGANLAEQQQEQLMRQLQALRGYLTQPGNVSTKNALARILTSSSVALHVLSFAQEQPVQIFALLRVTDAIYQLRAANESLRQTYQRISEQRTARSEPVQEQKVTPASAALANGTKSAQGQPAQYRLRPTTILALRALVASGLSLLIGPIISPDHPYWAMIAACMVTAISFGATKKKALARSIATLLGACVSFSLTALSAQLPIGNALLVVVLVVSLFMMMYVISTNPTYMAFWVIMFIALVDGFSGSLHEILITVLSRSIDTLIGSFIAIVITLLIFPTRRARDTFYIQLKSFLQTWKVAIDTDMALLSEAEMHTEQKDPLHLLNEQLRILKQDANFASYESHVLAVDRGVVKKQVLRATLLTQNTNQAHQLILQRHADPPAAATSLLLEILQQRMHSMIDAISNLSTKEPVSMQVAELPSLAEHLWQALAQEQMQHTHSVKDSYDTSLFSIVSLLILMDTLLIRIAIDMRVAAQG